MTLNTTGLTLPFFSIPWDGELLDYFRSLADAEAWRDRFGGVVVMTTTNRIWRVSRKG